MTAIKFFKYVAKYNYIGTTVKSKVVPVLL
jgi:hypothetical protein